MKFWKFQAKADTESTGELTLYGFISESSWWGDEVTPKQFKKDLDALGDIKTLNIMINSGGGDVFAAQAIHSMLRRHPANKVVYIDGLAASAATLVAMAGDTIYIPKNAMMMVHNPMTFAYGNAEELTKMVETLNQVRESMVATYVEKTGLEREKVIEYLDAETWMTAEEAVEYGFADELEEEKQIAASLSGKILALNGQEFDLTRFKNPPKIAAFVPAKPPEPEAKREVPLQILLHEVDNKTKKYYTGGIKQ